MGMVVMISGNGSNLQVLIDAVAVGEIALSIDLVVSNRKAAYGLERAAKANIPTLYFPLKPFKTQGRHREDYDAALAGEIQVYKPDLIVLAGWMHILGPAFLDNFPQKVINLHPALPGQFAGTHAIERAFAAYQAGEINHSGCMVHYAIPEVDAGAVIAQMEVPILPDDTLDSFATRMHETEHYLIVEAVKRVMG